MAGPRIHRYGEGPDQVVELTVPDGPRPFPVAVVLHGGFWRAAHGVELARPLAADLAAAGFAAVAVEYRRVGGGGGWPATLEDVAAALDCLPGVDDADRLDLADVTVIGHSAGGHLAAWAAARHRLPDGAPGAGPRVRVTAAVLQAAVLDLTLAHQQRLGDGAVRDFLGTDPDRAPERWRTADPVRLLPTGVPSLCVHASADDVVPVQQSERYAAAARDAGDRAEVRLMTGDHMTVIDPGSEAWRIVRDWMGRGRAQRPGRTTLGT